MRIERSTVTLALTYVAVWLAGFLVLAQFVPVDRTNPPAGRQIEVPAAVASVLERACYDCHSNRTEWPAYSRVAPVSWLVARHVREGREHLNYSTWDRYSPRERADLMEETLEEIAEGKMPMKTYLLLHPEAKLSSEDRAILAAWARGRGGPGEYAHRERDPQD